MKKIHGDLNKSMLFRFAKVIYIILFPVALPVLIIFVAIFSMAFMTENVGDDLMGVLISASFALSLSFLIFFIYSIIIKLIKVAFLYIVFAQKPRWKKEFNKVWNCLLIFAVIICVVSFCCAIYLAYFRNNPANTYNNIDTWKGFYYPNGCLTCEQHFIISPVFETKNECFRWADEIHEKRNYNTSDTYECGKNCKKAELNGLALDIDVCEETVNTREETDK